MYAVQIAIIELNKIVLDKKSTHSSAKSYMSTQREVLEGRTRSHRAKRANFGRGAGPPGNFQKPILQMVQSQLFLSYICEYN